MKTNVDKCGCNSTLDQLASASLIDHDQTTSKT